jgi:hypothetical protein
MMGMGKILASGKSLWIRLVILIICGQAIQAFNGASLRDRIGLRSRLLEKYEKHVIPDNVTLAVGLTLIHFDAHPEIGRFDTYAHMRLVWTDKRLSWDQREFGGLKAFRMQIDDIWVPDMALQNGFTPNYYFRCADVQAILTPDGKVNWLTPCTFFALCEMDEIKANPNARQNCELKFGSWSYDASLLDLKLYNDTTSVDMNAFKDVGDYKVTGSRAVLSRKHSSSPKDITNRAFVTFNVEFEQKVKSPEHYPSPSSKSRSFYPGTPIIYTLASIFPLYSILLV